MEKTRELLVAALGVVSIALILSAPVVIFTLVSALIRLTCSYPP